MTNERRKVIELTISADLEQAAMSEHPIQFSGPMVWAIEFERVEGGLK